MSYIALKTWNFAQSRFLRKHWHCILRFPENPPKVSHCLEWVSEQESVLPAAHIQQNLRCDYVSLGAQGMFTIRFSKVSFQSKGHHYQRLCPWGLEMLQDTASVLLCPAGAGAKTQHNGHTESWGTKSPIFLTKDPPTFCLYRKMKQMNVKLWSPWRYIFKEGGLKAKPRQKITF